LAIAEAERQFFEAEYEGYAASNANGAAFCRSAALIVRRSNLEIKHSWIHAYIFFSFWLYICLKFQQNQLYLQ
jgi:hypothetical protein